MFHVKHCYMNNYEEYLSILYKLALKSLKFNDIPVGAIVLYKNTIIGKGFNTKEKNKDICGHAEINAIKDAAKSLNDWRLNDCILLTTLKPCNICNEVIKTSRISKVFYLLDQNVSYDSDYQQLKYENNEFFIKYLDIFNNFFKNLR